MHVYVKTHISNSCNYYVQFLKYLEHVLLATKTFQITQKWKEIRKFLWLLEFFKPVVVFNWHFSIACDWRGMSLKHPELTRTKGNSLENWWKTLTERQWNCTEVAVLSTLYYNNQIPNGLGTNQNCVYYRRSLKCFSKRTCSTVYSEDLRIPFTVI